MNVCACVCVRVCDTHASVWVYVCGCMRTGDLIINHTCIIKFKKSLLYY